jgi:hypothetical protein
MKHSPSWEANSHSASQEIPRLLWNPKVHYRVHNDSPMVPILSQMNSDHTFTPYFLKIHVPNGLLSSAFPNEILYSFIISTVRATCLADHILLDLLPVTILPEMYKLCISLMRSIRQPYATSSLLTCSAQTVAQKTLRSNGSLGTDINPHFPSNHSNIIFPCVPRSSEWSLRFKFRYQSCYVFLACVLHGTPMSSLS